MPKSATCSAITQDGISAVWQMILDFESLTKSNNYFFEKRKEQNQFWMMETIDGQLKASFYNHPEIIKLLEENKKAVQNDAISPFLAANILLKKYFE